MANCLACKYFVECEKCYIFARNGHYDYECDEFKTELEEQEENENAKECEIC